MAVNQLKAGTLLSYVLIGVNILIGLLYTPFLLRMLGQSEYGLYSLAASVIAYLTVLDLGFGNAIVRYTAKFRAEGKKEEQYEMFGMFFLLYLGISLIAFVLALILAFNTDVIFSASMTETEVSRMRIILMLMAFNLAFTFPMSIWGSIITAYEDFVFQKVVNIARTILNPAVMIVLLLMGYKAVALVLVTTFFNVATLIVNCIYCRRKLHVKLRFKRFRWGFLKEVSIYSFWVFLNAVTDQIYWSTGQLILGIFQGVKAVAIYAVALQLRALFSMFSTAISSVFLPRITAMVATGVSAEGMSNLFIKTGRLQYIVISYILTGFILLGRPFICLWAGVDYGQAYIVTLIFFLAMAIPLLQNIGISMLMAYNKLRFRSLLTVCSAVLGAILAIPLSLYYGVIGCAVAIALPVFVANGIGMNIYYKKHLHIDMGQFWKEIRSMSIVPVLIICVGFIALQFVCIDNVATFILAVIVLSVVYIPCFYLFSMNEAEHCLVINLIRRIVGIRKG